jgi:hypothetical protein
MRIAATWTVESMLMALKRSSFLMLLQPAIIFAGELFEKEEALGHAKGLLLDFFRGRQVNNIALKVCACSAHLQCSKLTAVLATAFVRRAVAMPAIHDGTHSLPDWTDLMHPDAAHSAEADTRSCGAAGCGQGHVRQRSRCVHIAASAVPHPPQKDWHQGKHCNFTLISAL